MLQRKAQWLSRAINADDPQFRPKVATSVDGCQSIRGCAESHVLDDGFTLMRLKPLWDFELLDIEHGSLGFRPGCMVSESPPNERSRRPCAIAPFGTSAAQEILGAEIWQMQWDYRPVN
jgi:hypothetical protein